MLETNINKITMFSDADIKKQLEERQQNPAKGIYIDPFEEKYLTPVGYDLRIGKKGFSWKNKCEIDIEQERRIEIQPNDTVVIESLESVSLSKEVAATIHAMATQVVLKGLSHISTTIDPGWSGKLLIAFHNYHDNSVELRFGDPFCTVCFYRVESESKASLGRPADRDDLWQQLIEVARQEKQKLIEVARQEKKKKERENLIRNSLLITLMSVGSVIGVRISLKNPELGSAIAAFIALLSPFVYDKLKQK